MTARIQRMVGAMLIGLAIGFLIQPFNLPLLIIVNFAFMAGLDLFISGSGREDS